MLAELSRLWRPLCLILLAAALTACGGGGDDEGEDEDIIADEDATGLWQGSFRQAGVSHPFVLLAAPSGQFVGVVANTSAGSGRFMIGTGDVTQNILNATGTVFAPAGQTLPNGATSAPLKVVAGRVTTGVSLTGNYSAAGEEATLSLTFDAKTNRAASLTAVSGVYSLAPTPMDPSLNATLTISNGLMTYAQGSGCNGTGNIAVISSSLNIYTWTLSVGACNGLPALTFDGLATLSDPPGGSPNTLLMMAGATAARDRPFVASFMK